MSRFISLFLISCLAYISPLSAQKGCCDDNFNQGTAAFKAKNYDLAIRLFNQGNDCSSNCTHDFVALINQVKAKQEGKKIINQYLDSLLTVPTPHLDSLFFGLRSTPFVEPQMVRVEGGTFQMGGNKYDEKPIHAVTISGFYIGKYEVTQSEWRAVMGSDPEEFVAELKGDSMPIHSVSWDNIQIFLQNLNAKTGKKYRLPSEAEWEFAARGGNKSNNYSYSGSNDAKSVAWTFDNADGRIHPVGQKNANELGIYDMSGNVGEWCQDWYKGYPGSDVDDQTGLSRVARGDGWYSESELCRSTCRNSNLPANSAEDLGFRLALSF
jgi:formylglycine-generating enzyme required for sulfatase activity